jgi:membrane-bound lytic murein transglycosylase D
MPETGRELGLTVDAHEDERLASRASTSAAARYLASAFDTLGSWPLAVTAYNYGIGGMKAAAERLGSARLDDLIAAYRGPAFGNAVKNYYVQFLAAAHVAENAYHYFPELRGDPAFMPAPEKGVRRGSPGWPSAPRWGGLGRRRPARALDLLRVAARPFDLGMTSWRTAARPQLPSRRPSSHDDALSRLAKSLVLDPDAASGVAASLQSGSLRIGLPY